MAMQLKYNASGLPYLVGSAGQTVGPAPYPTPSALNKAAQNRAGADGKVSIVPTVPAIKTSRPSNEVEKQEVAKSIRMADDADDPLGKFLEYDVYGGVKMKFALPVFALLLVALRGRRRR
jgi:hypothetical protein